MGWREKNRPGFGDWRGRRRHWGGFYRHPRTTQELRREDPDEPYARRRRLPQDRDDLCRGDWKHFSWKRHRRTRWK